MAIEEALQLPFSFAKRFGVFIEAMDDEKVVIAHLPQIKSQALMEIKRLVKRRIELKPMSAAKFEALFAKKYAVDAPSSSIATEEPTHELPKTQDLLANENDAPVIRLLNVILTQALKRGADQIHIETLAQKLIVRYQIDGILQAVLEPPRTLAILLVSHIKTMAKLHLAEKRLPQDGHIVISIANKPIELYISTLPLNEGEYIIIRLIDKQVVRLDLTQLGISTHNFKLLQELIHQPRGMILITGPTSSGKTTTLYAALTALNSHNRHILTVEDIIEDELTGISQTQIDKNFAQGLRAILRHDPDVIMIGEIPDRETTEIAVQASLMGRLIFSTLPINNAISAITRLRDMGIESFLLSSTLIGIITQRLVRILCIMCKTARSPTMDECTILGLANKKNLKLYQAVGCEACSGTGYRGRKGIFEIIAINNELQQAIHTNSSEIVIENIARNYYPTLQQEGFALIIAGETTLAEVLRVTGEQ